MKSIKPIETYYNGYRFRSRLEARWAVFFDALNIKYVYEPEGYQMSDGTCYLPDFFLPDFNYYVEVKGYNDHLHSDLCRVNQFVYEHKTAVIILSNIPYDKQSKGLFWFPIMYYEARSGGITSGCRAFFKTWEEPDGSLWTMLEDDFAVGRNKYFVFFEKITDYKWLNQKEVNEKLYKEIQAINGSVLDDAEYGIKECLMYELEFAEKAFLKASQARFEHGEVPTIRTNY